jgi:ACR3 family arsenite efflux pump ArsB
MNNPFAKRASCGYVLFGLLGCGAIFLLWIGLTGRFQPLTTVWDQLGAVLVVLLFTTICLFLVASTVKELRTTFDETGV